MTRGLPESAGHLLHLYRAVHLADLIQNGILYSRWLPDLGYGYGYPIFNYYSPLSYYLVELLHLLGLDLIGAYLAVFVLAFIGASVFTYLWVGSVFNEPSALIAAATYRGADVLPQERQQRMTIVDDRGRTATASDDAYAVELEQAGPRHAIVKATG